MRFGEAKVNKDIIDVEYDDEFKAFVSSDNEEEFRNYPHTAVYIVYAAWITVAILFTTCLLGVYLLRLATVR